MGKNHPMFRLGVRWGTCRVIGVLVLSAFAVLGCSDGSPTLVAATTTIAAPTTTTTTSKPPATTTIAAPTTTTTTSKPPATTTTPPRDLPTATKGDDLGSILASETFNLGELGIGWRITYRSQSITGDPIEVTGTIAAPNLTADQPRPVLSIAHGTTGLADQCAPSLDFPTEAELWAIRPFLEMGWVVTATDYEGLGGPGLHRYIVGESEARGVLDIVRAARSVPGLGADGPVVVWGHSQGGHAALHVAQRWSDLAPELNLVGVAAGAPPSQFLFLEQFLRGSDFQGYLVMAAAGLAAAYDDLELETLVNPEYMELLDELEAGCTRHIFETFNPIPFEDLTTVDTVLELPEWKTRLLENDTNQRPNEVPTIILQGTDDEQIPAISSALLLSQLCVFDDHAPLERREYPGTNHATSVIAYWEDLLEWLQARVEGKAAADHCEP